MPISQAENRDCMEAMRDKPDNFWDLAVVDPEYGIGVNHNMGRRKGDKPSDYKPAYWDKEPPKPEYFFELFRVSKNQIIWGANHFISRMPKDSPCWVLWDKGFSEDVSFAQYEMAWTSFDSVCRKFDKTAASNKGRIHPTQKPVALYQWLLKNYAKPGDKILDTHLGSGSSRIAAYKMGFDFWGYEIDKDYFEAQEKRFKQAIAEPLFEQPKTEQGKLL
jgi:site-specific DNA-methyltransferase (adenine-specific)